MDKQILDQPIDPLTDPNLIMALGLMQNIKSSQVDNLNVLSGRVESLEEAKRKEEQKRAEEAAKKAAQEAIAKERTPVEKIVDKIHEKKILTREEVTAITLSISKEFSTDIKGKSPELVQQYLSFAYYVVLNVQPFSHGRNYLENQALLKLLKEIFNVVKVYLEYLSSNSKKETGSPLTIASLMNSLLPISLKILALFQLPSTSTQLSHFDLMHYKYLRSTHLKALASGSLQAALNPLLKEYLQAEAKPKNNEVMIEVPKQVQQQTTPQKTTEQPSSGEDFIMDTLEFVPMEYSLMAKSLQDQVHNTQLQMHQNDENMSINDEEEKEEGKIENVDTVIKELINKQKIPDLFAKTIDRLVSTEEELYLQVDSSLFGVLKQYLGKLPSIKSKQFAQFTTKTVCDRAIKTQQAIIEHFNKQKDVEAMQVDQVVQSDSKELQEQARILAKCLEISTDDEGFIKELIKSSGHAKYLSKLIVADQAKETMSQIIESITLSFCSHLQILLTESFLQTLDPQAINDVLTLLLRLVDVTRELNTKKLVDKNGSLNKSFRPQSTQNPSPIQQSQEITSVRTTRGQAKKKQQEVLSALMGNQIKEEKNDIIHMVLVNVDVSDLLKTSISLLASTIPYFIKEHSKVQLSKQFLKNLFVVSQNNSAVIASLITGILSEFTKPTISYDKYSITQIAQYIIKHLDKIFESPAQTILAIKFLFQISNTRALLFDNEISLTIAKELIKNGKWAGPKQASELPSISSSQNFTRFITLVACLFSINQNAGNDLQNQRQILARLALDQIDSLDFGFKLQVLQITLLNNESLASVKVTMQKFLTSLFNEGDLAKQIDQLSQDINGIINNMVYGPYSKQVFDPSLQDLLKDKLSLDYFLELLLKSFEGLSSSVKATELKPQMLALLKKFAFICPDKEASEIPPRVDLQTYTQNSSRNVDLLYCLYDMHVKNQMQAIFAKLTAKNQLSEDEIEFVNSQMRSLMALAKEYQEECIIAIKTKLVQKDPSSQNAELQANIIYECTKCIQNPFGVGKALSQSLDLQSLTNAQALDIALNKITDPQALTKHLHSLRASQKIEDTIYAHCLSSYTENIKDQQLQRTTSKQLMLRTLYQNLSKIVVHDQVPNVLQIAQELHRIGFEVSFLEYSDSVGGTHDIDTSDKIYNRIVNGQQSSSTVSNKEFQKFKSLDHVVNLLVTAREFQSLTPTVQDLVTEVATQTPIFNQFVKNTSDFKGLINYLSIENTDVTTFFKARLPYSQQLGDIQLWQIILSYLEITTTTASVEVKTEKKGGMQMVIEIDQPKKHEPKILSTRAAAKRKNAKFAKGDKEDAKQEQPSQETKEAPQQTVQKNINQIALKMLNFMIDITSTTAQSTPEQLKLAETLRASFGSLGAKTVNLVERLSETRQISILKSIIGSLIKSGDHKIQANLTNSIVSFLHTSKSYVLEKRLDALILSLELAEYVTVSNQELASFISSQLLQHSSDFFEVHGSQLTKLQVLDFMCQLAVVKYAAGAKYTGGEIVNLRRQNREEIKKRKDDRQKAQLAKTVSEEAEDHADNLFGISKQKSIIDKIEVEGFKQEKITHSEKDSMRFMEWPEENCTYSITKKNFRDQHWYFCYTCNFKDNSGVCGVCVKKCHKGHVVAYSKRTNFFCDCGDSGRCKCLKDQAGAPQNPPGQEPGLFSRRDQHLPFGKPSFDQGFHQRYNPFERPNNILDRVESPRYRPIEGMFGGNQPPESIPDPDFQEFLMRQQLRQQEERDHSSDDDLDPMGNGRIGQSVKNVMKLIKKVPEQDRFNPHNSRGFLGHHHQNYGGLHLPGRDQEERDQILQDMRERGLIIPPQFDDGSRLFGQGPPRGYMGHHPQMDRDPHQLQSQVSHVDSINPLEDPFSEAGMETIDHNQLELGYSQSTLSNIPSADVEMKQESQADQLIPEVVNLIQTQRSHFQEVYQYLCSILTENFTKSQPSQSQDQLMVEESRSSIQGNIQQKLSTFLNIPKDKISLVQDQTQYKKVINQGQFQTKLQNDNSIRHALQNSINIVNILDCNKQGLVAICEDQEVCFYGGSQFFEDASHANKELEIFKFQHKDGNNISKIDGQKVSFPPLQVLFNEAQPQYLAIAGPQHVEVLVLKKNGKVDYKISIDLMLETFGRDLTIVNIRWLPGSQSSLAVGTRDFIKIYDLGQDLLSPSNNIMIFNGFITDFAFAQNPKVNGNHAETTLFASSRSGQVFYMDINYVLNTFEAKQEGEKMQHDHDNSDMMMTEALHFVNKLLQFKENQTQAVSIYCTSNNVLVISFNEGLTLVGTKAPSSGQFEGFRLNVQEDPSFNSSNCKTIWQKQGESLCGFREIQPFNSSGRRDPKFVLTGFSRKFGNNQINSHGIPLMIEIKETKIIVNVVKNNQIGSSSNNMVPVIGQAYVKKSHRGSHQMRLLNIMVDSGAATYFCKTIFQERDSEEEKSVQDPLVKIENDIKLAHGNVDMLISKSDLPKDVQLSINFFEKMKSLIKDPGLCQQLNFNGDIMTTFRTSKVAQEILARQLTQNSVMLSENSKKNYKFSVALDPSSDHVITGLRIRMDYTGFRQQNHCLSFRLFNREQKFTNYIPRGHGAPLLFDVPFCDAEILFGSSSSNQNLSFEFVSEDPKQQPIRIVSIEVLGLSKKEFMYKEKIRKLEKLNADRLKKSLSSLMAIPSTEVVTDELIKEELLNTKALPIVTWREKLKYLSGQIDKNEVEAVIALDVLTQYLQIAQPDSIGLDLDQLLQKLKCHLNPENSLNKFELAAVKRCIKKIINVLDPNASLGSPYNYQTIKDQVLVTSIIQKIQQGSDNITLEQLRIGLRGLMKINVKRFYQVFKILEENPDLPQKIISTYLDLKKKDSNNSLKAQQQDICDIIGLIISNYQFQINQAPQQSTLQDSLSAVYTNDTYASVFQSLLPLITNEDEQIQKLTISNILSIANQYSKTLQVSLKNDKLPVVKYNGQTQKVMLVDFLPHLITFAFEMVRGGWDIGYQLAYKMTKAFEQNCIKNYEGQFMEQIVETVARFIAEQAFLQFKPSQLTHSGDISSSQANRSLYVNLVLTNMFLHHPQQDESLKIKSINLGLDASLQQLIIARLSSHLPAFLDWTQSMLTSFSTEFAQQKCSYRTKFDDGIPGKVYQVLGNRGALPGRQLLLRPVVETSAWKWHPLFVKSDSQFDLLDRKIPVQIMMIINFLISQGDQLPEAKVNALVQTISEFAFRKPAKSFLKEVGRMAIKGILMQLNKGQSEKLKEVDKQIEQTIRGFAIFHDFQQTFGKIYEQAFSKKGKPQLTYNLQFQLHSILEKGWEKASASVDTWSRFITGESQQRLGLVETLVNCAFYLNEESAKLCLQLAALSYDETCVLSFKKIDPQINLSLFAIFQKSHLKQAEDGEAKKKPSQDISSNLDIRRLIEVMLLGRNNKSIRTAASHLIKGIYDQFALERQVIKNSLIEKLPLLRTKGANAQEFVALLSYVINREIDNGGFQKEEEFYQRLCREIYKQVVISNQSLTAHENLNIYATLSKFLPQFSQSGSSQDLMLGFDEQSFRQMLESRHQGNPNDGKMPISNPYMLESEACSKCYSQKALPFQQQRANDLKVEAKFTDNRHIYKLKQAYQIKQLVVVQDGFRANKYAKEITLYINNTQGVDLADMKNNMAMWKKVKTQEAEPGQRSVVIDLTLPVTAQNILIEFTTGISTRIIDAKGDRHRQAHPDGGNKGKPAKRKKFNIDSIEKVIGIDSVIMSLSKQVAGTIGIISDMADSKDAGIALGASASDYDKLMCPRCQRPIQTKNGVCNNCGENAQQCPQCRHINYDKQDAYVCTECGFSRWLKMDIQLIVQQGFACEKIENEDQKAQALQQIDNNLQQAQQAYQQLMNNRATIRTQIKRANEMGENPQRGGFVSIYQDECADLYLKMMKSLNNIKSLKYEIDQFTSGSANQIEEVQEPKVEEDLKPLGLKRSYSAISSPEESQVQETCFSCIQEYLKGLLCFIQITAEKLTRQYKKQGFLELLYKENLKMYSFQLQDPTRRALCSLVKTDKENTQLLLKQIGEDLFNKQSVIPSHQLAQNITQETQLILDMLRVQGTLKIKEGGSENHYDLIMSHFWSILFKALVQGKSNSAIADQVAGTLISYVKDLTKASSDGKADQNQKDMNAIIVALFDNTQNRETQEYKAFEKAQQEQLGGKNFVIQALVLQSSQKVRIDAKDIINHIAKNQDLHKGILTHLIQILDQVLESSQSDQFFDLIQLLLTNLKDKIKPGETNVYLQTFDLCLKHVDQELAKLFTQELQRKKLGQDGYMPQISTGQALSRIVQIVSFMIKESPELKKRIQNNVNFVIKAFLRVKKLNLTKNKVIQNSEVEIEKMFKELHSEKEEEKANFILTCIKVIENGDCDSQEMRFLFEEICKVIDPVKPEPDYQIQFQRPRSQEEYFGGRMGKSNYMSSQFGKTMADVRVKICKETNTAEPELVELLVDNKLVNMDLTVKQVYEQVHWPALFKQRNPDAYDIPSIEEATGLTPMVIVYRLMGIDGEATEDRVETLLDGSEGDMDPANIQKKYGFTEILSKPFNSQQGNYQTTGIHVLTEVLDNFGSLVTQRYLAEWLFKLLGFALKMKCNRTELLKKRKTVDNLAKRLFESVGLQSQVENQKSATLFDVILVLLELVIGELNLNDSLEQPSMEIDQQLENQEAAKNVQIFIQILGDSCADMWVNGQGLDKTSKKIRAVSKILPFLINKEDGQAQDILIEFITAALLKVPVLDNLAELTAREKFFAQYNLDRVIEILDSVPSSKNYIKDRLHHSKHDVLISQVLLTNLLSKTLVDLKNEVLVYKNKLGTSYSLRFLYSYSKNHPLSQKSIFTQPLMDKLYELTLTKYKDKSLTIAANDIVISVTNKSLNNEAGVLAYFQKLIDQASDEKKRLAQKKKEEIMKQMNAKKNANKFLKQMDQVQEEQGPKCIVCQEGYTKKPTEVLGMYVFSKKLKICEMSEAGSGFFNTQGYTTVTHSNFIHFTCHQNAARVDQNMKIAKKEWEGAIIRNEHSKCNNLFPLKGGNLRNEDYGSMVDRFFQSQVKAIGNCDPDRVKVLFHDLKMIMKRLAYEESFSRDTHGGGPEHNMHFIPFMLQMSIQILQENFSSKGFSDKDFIYQQEKRLAQFLEQGLKMKRDFLQKLEEEKKQGEIEEEVKDREQSSYGDEDEDKSQSQDGKNKNPGNFANDENSGQMGDFSIDQIAYNLTSALLFCQLPTWESYKESFLTIILCTCANIKEESTTETKPMAGQTDFATGKRVLTIGKNDDVMMKDNVPLEAISSIGSGEVFEARKRRLSSDNRSELIQKALIRVRPLLVLMRLVDALKHTWDSKRLHITSSGLKHDAYLKRLDQEVFSHANLQDVIADCDEMFHEYKDRILKISSVEEFLQDMSLLEKIVAENKQTSIAQSLEQFILKHF